MTEDAHAQKRPRTLKRESSDVQVLRAASSRVTSPQAIVDGTLLPELAEQNLAGFESILQAGHPLAAGFPANSDHMDHVELTWGSACSGSEGVHFAIEACNLAMAKKGVPVTFTHAFSCENNKPKQAWINDVLNAGKLFGGRDCYDPGLPGCIFCDIRDLGSDMSKCYRHSQNCPVPTVDCLFLGTSCKDLSRANSSVDRSKLVLSQEKSRGASAQTFRGMLAYCKGHRPVLVVYENVDSIDDKISTACETNLSLLMKAMKDLGYEGQKVLTDGQEFGLPCRRRRLYILFIDTKSRKVDLKSQASGQVWKTFKSLVTSCMRSPPCSKGCLLSEETHKSFVQRALVHYQEAAAKNAQRKPAPQTWIDKHMAYADQLGYRWASPVSDKLKENLWYQTLTKREADALVLSRVADPTCEFRNLSQSLGRINSASHAKDTGKEVAPTMMPSQQLWVESRDRLLTGYEALIMQGFPIIPYYNKQLQTLFLSDSLDAQGFLHDLAGNAMALPVVLAIFQSGLASVPWLVEPSAEESGEEEEQEEDGDVAIALAAVAALKK